MSGPCFSFFAHCWAFFYAIWFLSIFNKAYYFTSLCQKIKLTFHKVNLVVVLLFILLLGFLFICVFLGIFQLFLFRGRKFCSFISRSYFLEHTNKFFWSILVWTKSLFYYLHLAWLAANGANLNLENDKIILFLVISPC